MCRITDDGARSLASAILQTYPRMDQLNMIENDISDDMRDLIVEELQGVVSKLDNCF